MRNRNPDQKECNCAKCPPDSMLAKQTRRNHHHLLYGAYGITPNSTISLSDDTEHVMDTFTGDLNTRDDAIPWNDEGMILFDAY